MAEERIHGVQDNAERSAGSMSKASMNTEKSPKDSGSSHPDDSDGSWAARRPGGLAKIRQFFTLQRVQQHPHITGLRGLLVIQSFFWTFFQTFIPTLVSRDTPGPEYQDLLREIFCVPLWNTSLIYNFFIILSMRTTATSFLLNPTGQTYAATIIRRNVRLVVILCSASGMATLIFSRIGTRFIDDFKDTLPNSSIMTPATVYDGGAAFNSLFNLFWLSYDHYTQAANNFWPTATLWAPSIIYFQSYTVYFLMVILPFTRPKWHLTGLGLFGLGSFWMGYWGWYSVTGLVFADLAVNPVLRSELQLGIRVREDWRIPSRVIALTSFAIGIAFKYAFEVRPQYVDKLLVLHPYLDISSRYSPRTKVADGPYARLDDWFVIVGIMLAVELSERIRYVLSFKPLVYLGERSFAIFTAQCIFFWTGGIKLWLHLHDGKDLSKISANGVVFLVGVLVVAAFAEIYFRLIDVPSVWLAKRTYTFLVT